MCLVVDTKSPQTKPQTSMKTNMQIEKLKSTGMANTQLPTVETFANIIELAERGKKAGIIFHDLANHITALTLSIGYLEDSFTRDGERLREYSRQSEKTRRQMECVAKILRAHIEQEPHGVFFPAEEIESIIKTFGPQATKENINIDHTLDSKLKIHGDSEAFFHIATNLISNAIESFESKLKTPGKNQKIQVCLISTKDDIVLSVSDNGTGIAPKNIDKIFDPYFSTKINGHGIGLSATKEFVEKSLRGTITVESSGSGTTFYVSLPKPNDTAQKKKSLDHTKQNRKHCVFPVFVR